jgi:succinylglutamate desuccinylase
MLATKALPDTNQLGRIGQHLISSIRGQRSGPTLVVVGSLHGNEPAGAIAAHRILAELQRTKSLLRGEVVLLAGNTRALARRARYIDTDLNRHWTAANISAIKSGNLSAEAKSEDLELRELLEQFEQTSERARGEIYFLDLHTTSAQGIPFATLGDTLRNRSFALNFPTTIVLGLEEQLEGTMLEYVNNLGAVTMGFEAGQHESESSIAHHQAVIWIALVAAGLLRREETPEFERARALLERASGGTRIVEVRHRHALAPDDEFSMKQGFENFQPVRRGETLAQDRHGSVTARETGMVLLPLYQKLGDDGFFIGCEVKLFWLKLSAILRRLKVGDYVHFLPGVRRESRDGTAFIVNTRIARLLPLQVFHLLGFRKQRWSDDALVVSRRPFDLAGPQRSRLKATCAPSSESTAIEFRHVSISFGDKPVLRDISFTLPRDTTIIITGASESGKSVLLHLAIGLLRPDSGQIFVGGREIDNLGEDELLAIRGGQMGMVFQDEALFTGLSVYDNAAYRLADHGWSEEDTARAVGEVLRFIGLEADADKFPEELSGGMRRRLEFARAFIGYPSIMLYDEPTSGLDPLTATQILDLIIRARDLNDVSSLLVTKQFNQIQYLATYCAAKDEQGEAVIREANEQNQKSTQVMLLDGGRIAFFGSYTEFAASTLPALTHLAHPEPSVQAPALYSPDRWGKKPKLRSRSSPQGLKRGN